MPAAFIVVAPIAETIHGLDPPLSARNPPVQRGSDCPKEADEHRQDAVDSQRCGSERPTTCMWGSIHRTSGVEQGLWSG